MCVSEGRCVLVYTWVCVSVYAYFSYACVVYIWVTQLKKNFFSFRELFTCSRKSQQLVPLQRQSQEDAKTNSKQQLVNTTQQRLDDGFRLLHLSAHQTATLMTTGRLTQTTREMSRHALYCSTCTLKWTATGHIINTKTLQQLPWLLHRLICTDVEKEKCKKREKCFIDKLMRRQLPSPSLSQGLVNYYWVFIWSIFE